MHFPSRREQKMKVEQAFQNREGAAVRVGDVVDVLTFGVEHVAGGTVTAIRVKSIGSKRVKVPMATILRPDGSTIEHRVLFLIPRSGS
jgi:hypothetical protein